jgi:hypothetical protein
MYSNDPQNRINVFSPKFSSKGIASKNQNMPMERNCQVQGINMNMKKWKRSHNRDHSSEVVAPQIHFMA